MSKARNLSDFISDPAIDSTELGSGSVTTDKLSDQSVTPAKLHNTLDLSSKTVTLANDGISGNSVHGGVISSFASTGIDDNASATAITIDSNGKVGVGTNSPTVKLEVDGIIASINSLQGTEQLQLQGYGGSAYINMNGSGSLIFRTGSTYVERARFRSEGYLELKSSDAYNQLVLTPIGTNAPASINFNTPGTGRAKIKVQDNEYISILSTGNVGIGTTSPGNALRVVASSSQATTDGAVVIKNEMNNGFETLKLETNNDRDSVLSFRSVGTNSYWWGMGIDNSDGGKFKMGADNLLGVNNRLVITQAGNVGIGTANPTTNFEINKSSARMKLTDGTNQINLGLWDGSNYRLEGDANRPIFITSYSNDAIYLGMGGSKTHKFKSQMFQHYRRQQNVHHQYVTSGSSYLHLKTNVNANSAVHMMTFILDWYSYGNVRHGQSRFSWHNDASGSVYSARSSSVYDVYTTSIYKASDGNMVLVQQIPNTYFFGWTLDCLHNMGYGVFDTEVLTYTTASGTSGAY